jgi:hypothetical protein
MIRMLLAFFVVWAVVFVGISFFWHSTFTMKTHMIRVGLYSLVTAIIAFVFMTALVVLF